MILHTCGISSLAVCYLCGGDVVDLDNALVGDYTVAKHSIL
jgi:hypothetical protein